MDGASKIVSIFGRALALRSQSARAAFLDDACAGDAAMRADVEQLLRLQTKSTTAFIEQSLSQREKTGDPAGDDGGQAVEFVDILASPGEDIGSQIGPYTLVQKIGAGGMGTVFMAEQREPVFRQVALKIVNTGMNSAQVIARFEAERQALAMMDHPNIAKIFDAGTTASGQPFFVMELVKGHSITQHCDDLRLPLAERLELFVMACAAIQHAHQKGIIHRDIKPSNVLVALTDGKPVLKVIDFGVAKAINQPLTDRTLVTTCGAVIGTLEYMSPEQAGLSEQGVDARSDIYSLGVLLYELLTGTTPIERGRLQKDSFLELLRIVREDEPPKPSTRLSTSADFRGTVAALRKIEPSKLTRQLRGELDWIVMRALEKDRARRYESASGLARDIERFLNDEPVEACPPSNWYRFKKAALRHKAVFAAAGMVAATLIAGLFVSTWMYLKENAARERAELAEREQGRLTKEAEAARNRETFLHQQADKLRADEAAARIQAQTNEKAAKESALAAQASEKTARDEARKSAQVATFLREIFNDIDPRNTKGRDTTLLREIADNAEKRLHAQMKDQPEFEADMRNTLGDVYGAAYAFPKAIEMHRAAFEIRRKLYGDKNETTLDSRMKLGRALIETDVPANLTEAEKMFQEEIRIREESFPQNIGGLAGAWKYLSFAFDEQKKYKDAAEAGRHWIEFARKLPKRDTYMEMRSLSNTARYLTLGNRKTEALAVLAEALDMRKIVPEGVLQLPLRETAETYVALGEMEKAKALYAEIVTLARKLHATPHPSVHEALTCQEEILETMGDIAGAEKVQAEVVPLTRTLYGENIILVFNVLSTHAKLLWWLKDLDKAEATFRQALALVPKLPAQHFDQSYSVILAAELLSERKKFDEAEALARRELAGIRVAYGAESTQAADCLGGFSSILYDKGDWAGAESANREAMAIVIKQCGRDFKYLWRYQSSLLADLVKGKKYAEAEPLARECLALAEKNCPEDWDKFTVTGWLGECLLELHRTAEAEPILIASYEGLTKRGQPFAADRERCIRHALERLVHLYETANQADKVFEWKTKLDGFNKVNVPP